MVDDALVPADVEKDANVGTLGKKTLQRLRDDAITNWRRGGDSKVSGLAFFQVAQLGLEEIMANETDPVAFDLTELTLVDCEAVTFLAACDVKGIELRNCPAFIREWMSKL